MKEYKYTINGNKYEVVVGDITDNMAVHYCQRRKVHSRNGKATRTPKRKAVVKAAMPAAATSEDSGSANKAAVNKANAVKAPLPGVTTDILVAGHDEVKAGDNGIVLEATKMAINLTAEKDGKATAICVKTEKAMEDDALIVIE